MTNTKAGFSRSLGPLSLAMAGLLIGGATDAGAADPLSPRGSEGSFLGKVGDQLSEWNLVLGAGTRVAPAYEGSDEYDIGPVPLISAEFGDRVTLTTKGLYVDAFETDRFRIGVHGGYEAGRSEDKSDDLKGMGDVDMGGILGIYTAYELGPVEFSAEIDKTLGGSNGLTGELGAKITHRWNRFTFAAGSSATWADGEHMEAYFGVSPNQAARSGLSQYNADAGFKRVDLTGSVTYLAGDHWLLRSQIGLGLLVGDSADSPIVKDELQPSTMISIAYKF